MAYAVMPYADYQDACEAVREKTGGTAVIKSGDMGAQIRAIDTQEDLSEELSEQDTLIADIMTALEGKSAASGAIETCTVTFDASQMSIISDHQIIRYTTVEDGVMTTSSKAIMDSTVTFEAACGTMVVFWHDNDAEEGFNFSINCYEGEVQSAETFSLGILCITNLAIITLPQEPMSVGLGVDVG